MASVSKTGTVVPFPINRDQDLIALMSGPVRRLARWPWHATHLAMKAGEPVSAFHARWTRLSLERLGGRLNRDEPQPPESRTFDARTGEPADPLVVSEHDIEEQRARRRRRKRGRR
jgi:hypothetical protein